MNYNEITEAIREGRTMRVLYAPKHVTITAIVHIGGNLWRINSGGNLGMQAGANIFADKSPRRGTRTASERLAHRLRP